ncbi:MAG: ribosomal-processing cysteine protease Prp [Lachnospiraceae bacterium]|uniref:ribosomal-processing cysteine protease Prp n=1 Tax=Sporofaciens musculi TaxID=2681861 RepID=UPI00256FB7B0|nr:ribosomal-processing cysteine protease Prp [Sporofaciens musculi]MCI9448347.1 ribosomal-processing cysteine protease Prp [Lachnospiraceae bacterium]
MIEVSVRKDGITVTGHSWYDQHGRDIVCAGVTALLQTLLKSIEDLTEDTIEYEISPGKADIKYGNLSEESKTLVDSFFLGICMISKEFPDYVQIA